MKKTSFPRHSSFVNFHFLKIKYSSLQSYEANYIMLVIHLFVESWMGSYYRSGAHMSRMAFSNIHYEALILACKTLHYPVTIVQIALNKYGSNLMSTTISYYQLDFQNCICVNICAFVCLTGSCNYFDFTQPCQCMHKWLVWLLTCQFVHEITTTTPAIVNTCKCMLSIQIHM